MTGHWYVRVMGRDMDDYVRDDQGQRKDFGSKIEAEKEVIRQQQLYPQATVRVATAESREQRYLRLFRESVASGMTSEDVLTTMKKKLGDYLQDVATAVRHDTDLSDRDSRGQDYLGPHIKTRHCRGRPFGFHGDSDRGFHITMGSRRLPQSFATLAEAEMALEIWDRRSRTGEHRP